MEGREGGGVGVMKGEKECEKEMVGVMGEKRSGKRAWKIGKEETGEERRGEEVDDRRKRNR